MMAGWVKFLSATPTLQMLSTYSISKDTRLETAVRGIHINTFYRMRTAVKQLGKSMLEPYFLIAAIFSSELRIKRLILQKLQEKSGYFTENTHSDWACVKASIDWTACRSAETDGKKIQ